ncbi:hypothetical protein ACIRP0_35825 [Streptomyces sp. NPDC101733]
MLRDAIDRAQTERENAKRAVEQAEFERHKRADGWLGWLPGRN